MSVTRTPIASRDQWLAMRARNVGASEIGALFGVCPFKTHLQLYAEKAGLAPAEGPSSAIMERGLILEPAVAEAVRLKRPSWRLQKADYYLASDDWRLGATPDYIVYDPARSTTGVLQTKAVAMPEFAEKWQDGPPLGYVLQTAQEAMLDAHCRGEPQAWGAIGVLAVSAYKYEAHVYEFERNSGAEARIIRAATSFWEAVGRGEPPAADFARDSETIRALYPADCGEAVDLSSDNRFAFLLDERARLLEELATARPTEKALEAVNTEIKAKMGAASIAICGDWEMSHKLQHRKAMEATSFRVLRGKRMRAKEMAA